MILQYGLGSTGCTSAGITWSHSYTCSYLGGLIGPRNLWWLHSHVWPLIRKAETTAVWLGSFLSLSLSLPNMVAQFLYKIIQASRREKGEANSFLRPRPYFSQWHSRVQTCLFSILLWNMMRLSRSNRHLKTLFNVKVGTKAKQQKKEAQ